ncbi:hypothetical protein N9Z67_02405 [Rhodopirellula sp.]|nr:hypothetical protein [Rhodopirellula sp.]
MPNSPKSNKGKRKSPEHPGPNSGYMAFCEGGRFESQRGGVAAFDNDGKQIRAFKEKGGNGLHQANFIDAVRQHDRSILKSKVALGNDSTGWCNMANVAYQAGSEFSRTEADEVGMKR